MVLDEGMCSDLWSGVYLTGLEWFWMKEWALISGQVFIWRVWSGSGWRNWLWSLVRCLSDGSGVVLDEGIGSDLWSGVYLMGLDLFWMKEWALISGQVFIWRVWSGSGWSNGLWSRVRCLSDGSGVVLDEGIGSDLWSGVYLTGLEWFWMKELALISGQVFIWWVWIYSGWRNGLWSLVRCLSDGSGVVLDEAMGSYLWSGVYLTGLDLFWMKEWALISGQVFIWRVWSGSGWRNWLWSLVRCLSDGSGFILDEGMGSDLWAGVYLTGLEWFWMKELALISGQVFIWWVWSGSGWSNGFLSLVRCLSDGSGFILDEGMGSDLWSGVHLTGLEWFWMKEWALISGQVFIWRVWSGSGWSNGFLSLVRCLSDGSGVVLDEGIGSDLWSGVHLTGLEWFWMKELALISDQVFIWWVWIYSGWRNGLWSLVRCLSDGFGVVLDEAMGSYLWSGVYLTGLDLFWMKEWALISGQVFIWRVWSGSGWRNWLWSLVRCLSDGSGFILDEGMGSDLWSGVYLTGLEWFWMKEWALISGQVFIWRVWSGSGWRNWLWSLVRCLSDGSGVVLDEAMGSYLWSGVYLTGLDLFWMKEWALISGQVFIWRVWSGSGWRNGLWSLVRCLSDGSGVVLDEGMGSDLWSGVYLTGLEWFWMKEWALISGQVFIWRVWSGSGWSNGFLSLVRFLSDGSGFILDEGMGSDLWSGVYLTGLEWFWMKELALISGQVFIWWVWIYSGWRNGLWSLVRCLSDGSGVVLDEGMGSDLWSGVYLTGLEWFWMKELALISGQVFIWRVWSGSGWRNVFWSLVRCLSDGSGVVLDEAMGSYLWSGVYLMGLDLFWMKEWALISGQVFIWRVWSGSGWRNGLWSLVRCLSDGSGVVLDEGMGSDLWSGVYLTGLEWFWMKEWALISGQVFIWRVWSGSWWRNGLWSLVRCLSDGSGWRNGLWSLVRCLSDGSGVVLDEGMGSDLWSGVYLTGLEWFLMKEWALISGQVFIWRVWMKEWALISGQMFIWWVWSGSGWRNGFWSLVRCSLTSSGIIGENSELLNWTIVF